MKKVRRSVPPSASSFTLNAGAGAVFFSLTRILPAQGMDNFSTAIVSAVAVTILLLAGEYFFLRSSLRPAVGLRAPVAPDRDRVAVKILSYVATLALCYGIFWTLPLGPGWRNDASVMAGLLFLIPVLAGGIWYIAWLDRRLAAPEDGLWHFGNLLAGRRKVCDRRQAFQHLISALLRLFFLPAMFTMLVGYIGEGQAGLGDFLPAAAARHLSTPGATFLTGMLHGYYVFAAMDMFFATIGYAAALRFFDTHVRSINPLPLGWLVCLVCYYPFFDAAVPLLLMPLFGNLQWYQWLGLHPFILYPWGAAAILAMCCEALTTTTFGVRFSNLNYRGILTGGLFRFTKHPQYVSKMFNRFLVFMPFLSPLGLTGVAKALGVYAFVCLVYFLRARTEEIHLARYPEYVRYADYIDRHGVFRWAGRLVPALRFSADRRSVWRQKTG